MWHIARSLDFPAVRVVDGKITGEKLWRASGWSARTGCDLRARGYSRWGVVTGYTWEQVLEFPGITASELLG